jgi:hypothetical protein
MMLAGRLERWLPSCPAISVVLRLQPATAPSLETLCAAGAKLGYKLARGSISVNERPELREWRFVFVAVNKALIPTLPELAKSLMGIAGVEGVELAHARN